jgi:hypothetical protein
MNSKITKSDFKHLIRECVTEVIKMNEISLDKIRAARQSMKRRNLDKVDPERAGRLNKKFNDRLTMGKMFGEVKFEGKNVLISTSQNHNYGQVSLGDSYETLGQDVEGRKVGEGLPYFEANMIDAATGDKISHGTLHVDIEGSAFMFKYYDYEHENYDGHYNISMGTATANNILKYMKQYIDETDLSTVDSVLEKNGFPNFKSLIPRDFKLQ